MTKVSVFPCPVHRPVMLGTPHFCTHSMKGGEGRCSNCLPWLPPGHCEMVHREGMPFAGLGP